MAAIIDKLPINKHKPDSTFRLSTLNSEVIKLHRGNLQKCIRVRFKAKTEITVSTYKSAVEDL